MAASATMNWANWRLATMTMDGATLGRMCRKSSRARPEPQGLGRVHELALLHRQDLPTDDASIHDPARD